MSGFCCECGKDKTGLLCYDCFEKLLDKHKLEEQRRGRVEELKRVLFEVNDTIYLLQQPISESQRLGFRRIKGYIDKRLLELK